MENVYLFLNMIFTFNLDGSLIEFPKDKIFLPGQFYAFKEPSI